MPDVVISYAEANAASARQLAERLEREGYGVWRPEGGSSAASSDRTTAEILEAKAVIVIWSAAACASEWIRAEAAIARSTRKLIQASADGELPPAPFDSALVHSISTWLGDENHAGWTGIRAALTSLAGAPAVAAAKAPAAVPQPPPAPIAPTPPPLPPPPSPAPPVSTARPSRGPNGVVIGIVVVVLVGLIAAAAWFMWRNQAPAPAVDANAAAPAPVLAEPSAVPPLISPPETPAVPANESFDRQAVLQGSAAATVRSSPSPIGVGVAQIAPGEAFSTYNQEGGWWRVRTAGGVTGYLVASSISLLAPGTETAQVQPDRPSQKSERRPEPRQPRGPRVRKENSEVMAAFCDGPGRGTRECRRFERSNY